MKNLNTLEWKIKQEKQAEECQQNGAYAIPLHNLAVCLLSKYANCVYQDRESSNKYFVCTKFSEVIKEE